MLRFMLIILFAAASASAWAQDPASATEPTTEVADEAEDAAAEEDDEFEGLTAEELEDLDLDGQGDHTEEDDDVFKPTDVVSFQQSVNFPVDI